MKFSEIKTHLSKFRVGIAGAGGLGSSCNIIVEAFNDAKMKEMLIETVHLKMPGIPMEVEKKIVGLCHEYQVKL